MLPPSSVTRNPSKQKRSASCAELWIIGRSDTTTLRASRYRLFGKRGARHGESVRRRTWSKELGAGNQTTGGTVRTWYTLVVQDIVYTSATFCWLFSLVSSAFCGRI